MLARPLYLLVLPILVLSGCTQFPQGVDEKRPDEDARARQFAEAGNYDAAANEYLRLAARANPPRKLSYQLQAAEAFLNAEQYEKGHQILDALDLDGADAQPITQKNVLLARVALADGRPGEALNILRAEPPPDTPGTLQLSIHQLRAAAYEETSAPLEAARERSMLDLWLTDSTEIQKNHEKLWEDINNVKVPVLQQSRSEPPDVLSGWIELAIITQTQLHDPSTFKQQVAEWASRYPGHPATQTTVPKLVTSSEQLHTRPRQIALLLPFTGQFSQAAAAVRDGFLAAWYVDSTAEAKPIVMVYDASAFNVRVAYQRALEQGADFVVGPLEKNAVAALVDSGPLPVTTLALNRYEGNSQAAQGDPLGPAIPRLLQFGLSPEDEARQVAERTWFDGHVMALVITPEGDWGDRVFSAFSDHWQELGGKVVEHEVYVSEASDLSAPIKRLLNVDSSDSRIKSINNTLKQNMKSESRRRQDVDFVFMAAVPRKGRQICPQLRFHHAADVPIYSTSHIFSGTTDRRADNDMNGVAFPDMPWVLDPAHSHSDLQTSLANNWTQEMTRYKRLYALGIDSYRVIPHLGKLAVQRFARFEGETGSLQMDKKGRIHRQLIWAQFVRGEPQLLDVGAPE
ncbi:MAG: penicillin-binding protein activator [Gammaproteobacteria bacterium]|nr:penicillin-binding protein activator [Gammaproteobacteria bacterium]